MKVKSENEVAQSCPTLSNPMDCSPPGSFVPWDFPGKSTGVGCHCLLLKRQVSGEARQEIQSKERLMSKMLGSVETRGIKDVYGPPVECLVEHRTRRLWDWTQARSGTRWAISRRQVWGDGTRLWSQELRRDHQHPQSKQCEQETTWKIRKEKLRRGAFPTPKGKEKMGSVVNLQGPEGHPASWTQKGHIQVLRPWHSTYKCSNSNLEKSNNLWKKAAKRQ